MGLKTAFVITSDVLLVPCSEVLAHICSPSPPRTLSANVHFAVRRVFRRLLSCSTSRIAERQRQTGVGTLSASPSSQRARGRRLYSTAASRSSLSMTSTEAASSAGEGLRRRESAANASSGAKVNALFPLSYKDGFMQWWSKIPAAVAEHKVLSFIPYLQQAPTQRQTGNTATAPDAPADAPDSLQKADPSQQGDESFRSVNDPYGPRCWRSRMVELSGRDRALNEFSVERVGEEADQNLVMLHGYGAGLGFFYKNFEPLSRAKGWKLYALDMLGMGRSTRPPFKITAKTREEAITQAEDWFIDALEEWRVQRKIERFTLLAHSLGGYMAVAYALKYPGHLNKLILASPVGIPENPQAVSEALPESSSEPAVAQEFKESVAQNGHVQAPSRVQQQPRRRLVKVLEYLWDANVSPFSIVRLAGPLGPRLVSGWTSRRFAHLPAEEAAALHDYSYSIFRLRGSGEYALAYILAPRAYARSPLIRRIQGVGRQVIRSTDGSDSSSSSSTSSLSSSWSKPEVVERETGIPIVFMYGEHDWMDVSGGYAAKAKIDAERERRRAQGLEDNGTAKVVVIPKAGHHLYLDSPEIFNEFVLQEMEDVRRREQEKKR